MRVVIDTNALVSRLLVAGSVSAQAVDKALTHAEVVVSEETMEELADVLSRKKWNRYASLEDRQEFIRRLLQVATMVPVISEIADCRDSKDDQFLALAADSEADYIISGDRDLLALHPWRGVQIITPAAFLAIKEIGPELETERLLLRQWQAGDFDQYAAFYADGELSKYIGGPCDRSQAWRRWAAEIGHWTLRGYGYWAVEEKQTGRLAGCVGLWFPEGWPELELGYWMLPTTRGKGYASEACLESRRYAYQVLGATSLVSYIHPDNDPSRRVAERLGAQLENTIELLSFGPHCVYRHPRADTLP